ncbi:MAG: AAA family ATPase [Acidobacteria bacterium]|nr:AAA family ATPase [Acidobacteriota bacterium]
MFSALLVAPDSGLARVLEQLALESKQVRVYKAMNVFPSSYELTRMLNCFRPDIILLDFSRFEDALSATREIHLLTPETALIGLSPICNPERVKQALEAGVGELLTFPITEEKFLQSVERAMRKARPARHDNLLAFLPAKAGSGASTVAVNVAGSLAHHLEQNVLVIEADLASGIMSDLLKFEAEYSVMDALETAERLDSTLWDRIVSKAQGVDFLTTPRWKDKSLTSSWANYHQLLQFVRPRYDTVIVDLPELVNDATVEIVRRASHVYIVATPELPSLILARRRRRELENRAVPGDHIGVLVNRFSKRELTIGEVEKFLGQPVAGVLPNDYQAVRRAIMGAQLIESNTRLGKAFTTLASELAGAPVAGPTAGFQIPLLGALLARKVTAP